MAPKRTSSSHESGTSEAHAVESRSKPKTEPMKKKAKDVMVMNSLRRSALGSRRKNLNKQLSFVQGSTNQLCESVFQGKALEFRQQFWTTVLSDAPAVEFHYVNNYTLHHWILVFTTWSKNRLAGKMKALLNLPQLLEVLGGNMGHRVGVGLVKLFDPDTYKILETNQQDKKVEQAVKVNIIEVMTAGVLLSKLISKRHKMFFVYSLFDFDSTGVLHPAEFATALKTIFRSLSAVFRIPSDEIPSTEEVKDVAASIYKSFKEELHGGVTSGDVQVADLADWIRTETAGVNPAAMTIQLLLQRYCSERFGEVSDNFDDGIDHFLLNWRNPVTPLCHSRCPVHGTVVSSCKILKRQDVINAKIFFEDLEGTRRHKEEVFHISRDLDESLRRAIDRMRDRGESFDFVALLRILCPCAQPKHITMFLNWCEQHEKHLEEIERLEEVEAACEIFQNVEHRPFLPERQRRVLENDFDKMDTEKKGFVTPLDLERGMGWTRGQVQVLLLNQDLDLNQNQHIEKFEFLKAMCPEEYRLQEASGDIRDMLGQWLKADLNQHRHSVEVFQKSETSGVQEEIATVPLALLPPAPDHFMRHCLEAFHNLDLNEDGLVSLREILEKGVVSDAVARVICRDIDTESARFISQKGFINQMCRANGYRPLRSCDNDQDDD